MLDVYFIYADNCAHCNETLQAIQSAVKKCKNISCRITKLPYTHSKALQIAIEYAIDTLPGFVIGEVPFNGSGYTEEQIVEAIERHGKIGHNTK